MVTIHHLGVSQSDRIVWLMEELEQPYQQTWHNRGEDFLAPPDYRSLHPVGTAPVIEDGDLAAGGRVVDVMRRREDGIYTYLKQRLAGSDFLGADRFTCADIMAMFNLTSLEMPGARSVDDTLPNTRAYVERVSARPAYQKAMSIAGPTATPPAG